MTTPPIAHPPETLEGWYALKSGPAPIGWSCLVRLIGSTSDLMVIHFRESLDAIGAAQDALSKTKLGKMLQPEYAGAIREKCSR